MLMIECRSGLLSSFILVFCSATYGSDLDAIFSLPCHWRHLEGQLQLHRSLTLSFTSQCSRILCTLSCKSFIHECRKHTIYACHNAKHLQLWPDTVNKKSADSLYSLQMTWFTDPYKNVFKKIHQKFHEKAIQSNILWLNLNKICGISILQSAHKQCQASFHFHVPGSKRRYPCTQTVSAVPNYFPCLLQFCGGYRIWHAPQVWKWKTSEKRWFTYS